jgi:hypothetical protein
MKSFDTIAFGAALTIAGLAAFERSAAADCEVNFSDYEALQNTLGQSRTNETHKARLGTGGKPEFCPDPDGSAWSKCYAYRQRCGSFPDGKPAYVHAWPWGNNEHYHLGFKSNAFSTFACSCDPRDGYGPGLGMKSGGTCITPRPPCPDWAAWERTLTVHDSSAWLFIFAEKGSDGVRHTFKMNQVHVAGGSAPHIQLWWKRQDNSMSGWSDLGPGLWNVNIPDAREVWISAKEGSGGPASILGYTINPTD